MKYANIIVDITNENVDKIFHYLVPERLKDKIRLGMRVFVPFGYGNRIIEGYVIGFSDYTDIEESRIKEIASIPEDYSIFSENMIHLAKYIADRYYCTKCLAFQCIMPKIVANKLERYIYINYEKEDILSHIDNLMSQNNDRAKIINYLLKNPDITVARIKKELNIKDSPIKTLEKNNIIKIGFKRQIREAITKEKYIKTSSFKLNNEQQQALDFINSEPKKPVLLFGVTGAGKTEVYMQVIENVINKGKQAIVLVPEISLTPQTVERFVGRFGDMVSVTHSRLSDGQRFDQWQRAKDGDISIMIGARSAIFTPFDNLGIVIIDEEHESSYKSETTPKYDTREVAIELCKQTGATLVLGSATPSVDSYYKARSGDYHLVSIKNRINNRLPNIEIVDMREELKNNNKSIFSKDLYNAIKENLDKNLQTILFLNRRGHSTFVSCRACGYVMECENCNVNYTYHSKRNKLICHYCNSEKDVPNICPSCSSKYIRYFGVGTQKIEEEVAKHFPEARVLRMDIDATSKKNSHEKILEQFREHKADILIGTQMIAKGLDFPKVSLVGVLACDIILNSGDYKSSEYTFSLLTQVAGRAGRAEVEGKVFLQTYMPEHYSIVCARNNDYLSFYKREIEERKQGFYPPFSNIFFIVLSGKDEEKVFESIKYLHSILIYYNQRTNFFITDVAKADIYKLKNEYRYKIYIKAEDETRLKNFVMYCIKILKEKKDMKNIYINISLNPNYMQ